MTPTPVTDRLGAAYRGLLSILLCAFVPLCLRVKTPAKSSSIFAYLLPIIILLVGCQPQHTDLTYLITQIPIEPPPPSAPFKDVSDAANIRATHRGLWLDYATGPYENGYLAAGSAWADFDNDGWVDLFTAGNLDPNVLYQNQRDGTFKVAPQSDTLTLPDIPSGGAVWADFDNDGWRDLYVLNLGENRLFRNIAGKQFIDVTTTAGVGDTGKGSSAAWGDYDADGFLDLYVTNWTCYPDCDPLDVRLSQDVLYHNNGDGTFSNVSHTLEFDKRLGAGFAASFADYDNDGDLDIYVINDKVSNAIGNILWRNDGPGCLGWCWTDIAADAGAKSVVHGMGLATGDYDNDGDLDFYFSNMVASMVLLKNQGDGTFLDATQASNVGFDTGLTVGWGAAFFDYDNDGWLDLYQTATAISDIYGKTGMMFPFHDNLYRNIEGHTFETIAIVSPDEHKKQPGMGFSVADYNNDGQMDFLVGNWNTGYRLYQNQGSQLTDHHWLKIQLSGWAPTNRDAIGTRIYLYTDDGRVQMREVKSGSSIGSSNDIRVHFGLGHAEIDQLKIVWPQGQIQIYDDVPSNQIWHIQHP